MRWQYGASHFDVEQWAVTRSREDQDMIKFITTLEGGKQVIGLVIVKEELDDMRKGNARMISGQSLGIKHDIMVGYAKNEEAGLKMLREAGIIDNTYPKNPVGDN